MAQKSQNPIGKSGIGSVCKHLAALEGSLVSKVEVFENWQIRHGDTGAILYKRDRETQIFDRVGAVEPCSCVEPNSLVKNIGETIRWKLNHPKTRRIVGTLRCISTTGRSRHFIEFMGNGDSYTIYHLA